MSFIEVSGGTSTAFPTQMPNSFLESLGIRSKTDQLVFGINVIAGSGGALALLAADLGRYAKSSSGIGLAVGIGGLTLGVFMVAMGGIVMYVSLPLIIELEVLGLLTTSLAMVIITPIVVIPALYTVLRIYVFRPPNS